ncbi:hypothetical protein N9L68_08385 [bacterium]|nr:hypothetical protein [bacterium]
MERKCRFSWRRQGTRRGRGNADVAGGGGRGEKDMQVWQAEAGEARRKCRHSRRRRAVQGGRCAQRLPTFGGGLLAFRNGSPKMERKLTSAYELMTS